MANEVLGGEIECKESLCALLMDRYKGKWLTRCWVVEKEVSYPCMLY